VLFGWILFPFVVWPLINLVAKIEAPGIWITLACSLVIALGLEFATSSIEGNKRER